MHSPEDKENIVNNYKIPQTKGQYISEVIEEDLGCVTLSESDDEYTPNNITGVAVTEEFLDQAEKCLMDIERFETEEEVKMQLINLLYHHIQLQRQGSKEAVPITYTLLKRSLTPEEKPRKNSEEEELDPVYFQPFGGENDEGGEYEDDETQDAGNVLGREPQPLNPDEVVIKPKMTFEELLAEELRKEELTRFVQKEEKRELEKQLMPPPPPKQSPKRKFLKRGEGIARFNSAPVRKPLKSKSAMKPESNTAPKRTVGLIKPASADKAMSRTNKLPSKIKIEDPISVVPGKDPVKAIRSKPVMSPVRDSSPTRSPQHSISRRLKGNVNSVNSVGSVNSVEISGFLNPDQLEERLAAEEEELEEFRMLEQAAADKSINSLIGMLKFTTSSGVQQAPQCGTIEEAVEEAEKIEEAEDDFDDNETWGFRTPVKQTTPERIGSNVEDDIQIQDGVAQERTQQPSKLLGSLFPGLKPPPPLSPPKAAEKKPDPECESLKAELKSKLAELEKEVARFQQEAAGLARARAEKESELRKLRQENDKYVEDLEERENKFQEYKDRELKMIRAEKKQFEMSQLSAKQRAAKLELVDGLAERVKSLEDELTRKEERWNATFSRLKNKGESKEKECEDLHKQISVLEQEKLALWEKEVIRSSNKRHKHVQTDGHTHKPSVKTEALPTTSECTIRPSLLSRHPGLASVEQSQPKAAEPEYHNVTGHQGMSNGEVVVTESQSKSRKGNANGGLIQKSSDKGYINLVDNQKSSSSSDPQTVKSSLNNLNEPTIRHNSPTNSNSTLTNSSVAQAQSAKSAVETIGPDGSVTVKYGNGTVKHISADGRVVTMTYFNGDTKKTFHDGRVVYNFLKDGITQTQLTDGTERTLFPTGQEETKYPDGRVEIKYPDNSTKVTYPNGEEKSVYADGTIVTLDGTGQRLILLPNGQREVHTSAFKRREYPDGTSKTVFNDGRQETIHANGRIRKKDPKGNLTSDVVVDATGKLIHDYLTKIR